MSLALKISGIAVLILGAIIWFVVANNEEKRKADLDWRLTQARWKGEQLDNEKELRRLKQENVRVTYGEIDAYLYYKCTNTPPKEKENQLACKKLMDKIEADDKKAAKEKW